ncbi:Zinc finger protein [Plakobranchus ocellatus]|uniref:Zinc finger protein n=1 Tax=Plakobranchus ocellatus TaxID=259542 RepID=A0AAV3ZTA3_9GAST|nr:Zinc finger protein [Plakobranchus ocellatus]
MLNMKPKTRQIHSSYIKNSNGLRVKQYLNMTTRGILLLEFQLGDKVKGGDWEIEVNLDNVTKKIVKFKVEDYRTFSSTSQHLNMIRYIACSFKAGHIKQQRAVATNAINSFVCVMK